MLPEEIILSVSRLQMKISPTPTMYLASGGFNYDDLDGTLSLSLHVKGSSHDDLRDQIQRIRVILNEISHQRARGDLSGQVSIRLHTSQKVFLYVRRGHIDESDITPGALHVYIVLTLECYPVLYGDVVTIPQTEVIGQGGSGIVPIYDVPGSADSLVRLYLRDESTNGAIINRIRMARIAEQDMLPESFTPRVTFAPAGEGQWSSDTSEDGEDYVRVTSTPQWQRVATITKPPGYRNSGMMNVLPRIRSGVSFNHAPKITSTVTSDGIGVRQERVTSGSGGGSVSLLKPTLEGTLLVFIQMHFATPTNTGWTNAVSNIWYWPNNPGGITDISFTTGFKTGKILELMGFDGITNPLDVTATNTVTSPLGASTSHPSGTTPTISSVPSMAFTYHNPNSGPSGNARVSGYQSGWTVTHQSGGSKIAARRTLSSIGTVSGTAFTDLQAGSNNRIAVFNANSDSFGTMPAANYRLQLVPYDMNGDLGEPSDPVTVTLDATGAIHVIGEPGSGSPAGYYLYYKRAALAWRRFDAGENPEFLLKEDTGEVVDIPTSGQHTGMIRYLVGAGTTGKIMTTQPAIDIERGNNEWHVPHISPVPLSPTAPLLDQDPESWRLDIEVRHPSGGWPIDIECAYLFDHTEPQMMLEPVAEGGSPLTLTEKVVWRFDLRPDGSASAVILDAETLQVIGHVRRTGRMRLRHGDNLLAFITDIANHVHDDENTAFSVWGQIIPGFTGLRGGF